MGLLDELDAIREDSPGAFLAGVAGELYFRDVLAEKDVDLSEVRAGDVVALIGDFGARDIATLLRLFDRDCVVVPLTDDTRADHPYFFESALVDWVIEDGSKQRCRPGRCQHASLNELREREREREVIPDWFCFPRVRRGGPRRSCMISRPSWFAFERRGRPCER